MRLIWSLFPAVPEGVKEGDTFSYAVIGGADAAVFSISGNQLVITDGVLDFNTKNSSACAIIKCCNSIQICGISRHQNSIAVVKVW